MSECVLAVLVLLGQTPWKLERGLERSHSEGPNWTALQRVAAGVVCSTARLVPKSHCFMISSFLSCACPCPMGVRVQLEGCNMGTMGPPFIRRVHTNCPHALPPANSVTHPASLGEAACWFEYLVSRPDGWGAEGLYCTWTARTLFAILVRIRDGKDVMIPISRLLSDVA